MTSRGGTAISEKVVRRIMAEEGLAARVKGRRNYNPYQGGIPPPVPNMINRDFHAKKPDGKWLTDITEFATPAGKVYL
ncbi:MAG: IS3 family transposase, partial [Lachnospiraceae bacterium]|nr:IS3 family transposase [Lachnospiraceae bacterium]